ncbi:MAG: cytochrome c biogenesis protein DipZ [Spirochaetia bacterium]|jgi:cytochrome c biogenesis protein CcdA/thiol-disulfide isomerase/thioredoxin
MLVLLAFAFVSGVITILSPCILPVLPIVLSGSVGGGKARPFGVLAGFVVSFTVFTLTLSAIVRALGIPADALRVVAVVLIALFGIVMLVPKLREGFERMTSRIANRGSRASGVPAGRPGAGQAAPLAGLWSGLVVGFSLGLVWTPCVGPIMASVISLALTQQVNGGSVFITLAYTLGTSIPMLAVMLGGRALLTRVPALTRNSANIQKGFGVLMLAMSVAIGLGWDRRFQAAVLRAFPNYGTGLTAIEKAPSVRTALKRLQPAAGQRTGGAQTNASGERIFSGAMDAAPVNGVLGDYGIAPEFVTTGMWFNTEGVVPMEGQLSSGGSPPLMMTSLRGRVVLVDFWTYSCVNCVRTLPYLRAWYDTYRTDGLVIVGVHTPEFEFEMKSANVAQAIKDLGVDWPVVQDNEYKQWNAYANQYWPAHYFIDAKGHVRYFHFGEGDYDVSEKVIQALLKEAGANVAGVVSKPAPDIEANTPETYLGYDRARGFASSTVPAPDKPADYMPAKVPQNGEWNLTGRWTITPQYVVPETSGTLQLGFNAKNVFLVIEPAGQGGTIGVSVDGKKGADTPDVKDGALLPRESRMYQLVGLKQAGSHLLRLEVQGKVRLFAFTFG